MTSREIQLCSPVSGVVVPIDQVPDPVFAQKIVGDGVAIDPTLGEVIAPFAGTISQLHAASHAVAVTSRDGIEVLIHVGLDTVKLRGEGFNALVKKGDVVSQGQPLIRFDLDLISKKAKSLLTEIVMTQVDQVKSIQILAGTIIEKGAPLMKVSMKREGDLSKAVPQAAGKTVSGTVKVLLPTGFHARPAATLATLAKKFNSEIWVIKNGNRANVRSIVAVMGLDIGYGDTITLEATGSDVGDAKAAAQNAINTLIAEIKKGLGDDLSAPVLKKEAKSVQDAPKTAGAPGVYTGVVASPGQTLGHIFQLKSDAADILVSQEMGSGFELESETLSASICEAKLQLETIIARLKKEADANKALIFAAHQDLLDDPALLDIAQNALSRGKSAAFAWKLAYTEISGRLRALNNQLLAARANDVKDVGQRVLHLILGESTQPKIEYPKDCILVAEDLTPSDVATLDRDRVLGLVTSSGGATSHVAILARSLDLPALAGATSGVLSIPNGTLAVLDASHGQLRLNPSAQEIKDHEGKKALHEKKKQEEQVHALEPALTSDGKRIEVVANLKASNESKNALSLGAEGVGLLRTEFLFMDRNEAPTEEEQLECYSTIARAFGKSRPLIIRTLDVGGDKPLKYLPLPKEENPFLGERGIRVSLSRPDVFRVQLRAILRAAEQGDVRVMFPMITTLSELRRAKEILEEERVKLKAPKIQVGIMVEVPSVAILADVFAKESDFFSIGSNDLSQYTLAIDRGHPKLASQVDGLDPSLLRLIDQSVRAAHACGKWVGVCGGIASDPQAVPILIGLGVDELSVSIPTIPSIKAQIRSLSQKQCVEIAKLALQAESAAAVRALVEIQE